MRTFDLCDFVWCFSSFFFIFNALLFCGYRFGCVYCVAIYETEYVCKGVEYDSFLMMLLYEFLYSSMSFLIRGFDCEALLRYFLNSWLNRSFIGLRLLIELSVWVLALESDLNWSDRLILNCLQVVESAN